MKSATCNSLQHDQVLSVKSSTHCSTESTLTRDTRHDASASLLRWTSLLPFLKSPIPLKSLWDKPIWGLSYFTTHLPFQYPHENTEQKASSFRVGALLPHCHVCCTHRSAQETDIRQWASCNTLSSPVLARSVDIRHFFFLLQNLETSGSIVPLLTMISLWQSHYWTLKYQGYFPRALEIWANRLWTAQNLLPAHLEHCQWQ